MCGEWGGGELRGRGRGLRQHGRVVRGARSCADLWRDPALVLPPQESPIPGLSPSVEPQARGPRGKRGSRRGLTTMWPRVRGVGLSRNRTRNASSRCQGDSVRERKRWVRASMLARRGGGRRARTCVRTARVCFLVVWACVLPEYVFLLCGGGNGICRCIVCGVTLVCARQGYANIACVRVRVRVCVSVAGQLLSHISLLEEPYPSLVSLKEIPLHTPIHTLHTHDAHITTIFNIGFFFLKNAHMTHTHVQKHTHTHNM